MLVCRLDGSRSFPSLPSFPSRALLLAGHLLALGGCGTAPPGASPDAGASGCDSGEALLSGKCTRVGLPGDLPCPPGEWQSDSGACQPAGLPRDAPCPPGEWQASTGACAPAGVDPADCAPGFVPDDEHGCEAVLPPVACPPGQMAIPGETTCHEVSPCGTRDYGNIPGTNATTQHVNQAYAGVDSDGTEAKPWKTVQQGVKAAVSGAIVAIGAGTYTGDVVLQGKSVILWGRCPSLTQLVGTSPVGAALQIAGGAAHSVVRGLGISGPRFGVFVSGAAAVELDHLWIHGSASRGIDVEDSAGPASLTVHGSLIEQNTDTGLFVAGASATVDASVIRDTLENTQTKSGRGIGVQIDRTTKRRGALTLTGSVVERNQEMGLFASGGDITVNATVIRGNLVDKTNPLGAGLKMVVDTVTKARSKAAISAAVIEQNESTGVWLLGSDLTLTATVIKGTQATPGGGYSAGLDIEDDPLRHQRANAIVVGSLLTRNYDLGMLVVGSDARVERSAINDSLMRADGSSGMGASIEYHAHGADSKERARVTIVDSVIERSHQVGVSILGADLSFERSAVRDTSPSIADPLSGVGFNLSNAPMTEERAAVQLVGSLVERNSGEGLYAQASDLTVLSSVVKDTRQNQAGRFGMGLEIDDDPMTKLRSNLRLSGSLVENNFELGVFVVGSDATIESSVVKGTLANSAGTFGTGVQAQVNPWTMARSNVTVTASRIEDNTDCGFLTISSDATLTSSVVHGTRALPDGTFGDGVSALAIGAPASMSVQSSEITENARAGISNFGADVQFVATLVTCNQGFDLAAESGGGRAFSFSNSDANLCGCPIPSDSCMAVSANLAPPLALDPTQHASGK